MKLKRTKMPVWTTLYSTSPAPSLPNALCCASSTLVKTIIYTKQEKLILLLFCKMWLR